jgi:DNA (cytosine-5)-methyltransferase 1
MPNGNIVTPDIRDAERLQGFPTNWTKPAEEAGRPGFRWKLVGNAVSVPVAKWIGEQLTRPQEARPWGPPSGLVNGSWPKAAALVDGRASIVNVTTWPVRRKQRSLEEFLNFPPKDLSLKATKGFHKRFSSSTLRAPHEFRQALQKHIRRMQTHSRS